MHWRRQRQHWSGQKTTWQGIMTGIIPGHLITNQETWFTWTLATYKLLGHPVKLSHHCLGPFVVVKKVGNGAYRLKLPPSMSRLHPVFNVVKLLPAPGP